MSNNDEEYIRAVISHYKKHGRHDLIWRKKITPYRILVSEVMLQQTQVSRVVEKFDAWIKKYPTLDSLSKATLQDLLLLWQGLGYQRRAKSLFLIAKQVKKIPKNFEELLLLPGIGSYTASAICAFAYDTFSYPVLETNIRTVLIEWFYRDDTSINDKVLMQDLLRLESCHLVKKIGAREWYYALMDYGAYLKVSKISHNVRSKHYKTQTKYKGSLRELRAKTLFAIAKKSNLPKDDRLDTVLIKLKEEGFIIKKNKDYILQEEVATKDHIL
jgi:A/G-specific adenine glycosylase